MNRTLVASLLLACCILIGIMTLTYIEHTCADMIEITDDTISAILTENQVQLEKSISQSIKLLEKNRPFLNIITGQDETIELRGNLNKAIFFCNCKEYDTAVLHLQEYKTTLNRIISSNEPTISTIF